METTYTSQNLKAEQWLWGCAWPHLSQEQHYTPQIQKTCSCPGPARAHLRDGAGMRWRGTVLLPGPGRCGGHFALSCPQAVAQCPGRSRAPNAALALAALPAASSAARAGREGKHGGRLTCPHKHKPPQENWLPITHVELRAVIQILLICSSLHRCMTVAFPQTLL